MKHLNLLGTLSLLFLLIVQSSCSKDDSLTFKFDENGECYYPSVSPISTGNFEKSVVGSGWKHVSTYEIGTDGECMKGEYYADLIGVGPHHYFFESSNSFKMYYYADAYPANGFMTTSYSYVESVNGVAANSSTILQILSVDGDVMKAIEYMAVRADGKKVFGYSTYKRMSAQELKKCQESYPTDLTSPRDIILSVTGDKVYISGKSYSFEILDGNGNYRVEAEKNDICSVSMEGNKVTVDLHKNGALVHISDRLKHKYVWIFSTDKSLEPTGDGIYNLGYDVFVFNKNKEMFTREGALLSYEYLSMPLFLREGVSDGNLAERNPVGAVVVDGNRSARHIPWDSQGFVRDILPQSVVDGLIVANTTDMYEYDFRLELVNSYGVVFQVLPFRVYYKSDFKEGDSWAIK